MSPKQNGECLRNTYVKVLMGNSASASIIHESYVSKNNFIARKTSTNKCSRMGRSFSTSHEAEITFKMPEVNVMAHITAPLHVTTKKSDHDVIFGRDLLRKLGI